MQPNADPLQNLPLKLNLQCDLADIAISPMQPRFEQSVYPAPLRPEEFRAALPPNQFGLEPDTVCLPGLPALPLTLAEMELLLQGPVVDLGAIAEVAKRDASLTAQLLWLANREREESDRLYRIEACLVQLGISVLRELVQETPPLSPSDGRGGALLNHSRLTALAAEAIAFQIPGVDPEKAYLAGLLHLLPEMVSLGTWAAEKKGARSGEIDEWPLPTFAWEVIRGSKHPFAVSGSENGLCEVVRAACEWVGQATLEPTPELMVRPNSRLTQAP